MIDELNWIKEKERKKNKTKKNRMEDTLIGNWNEKQNHLSEMFSSWKNWNKIFNQHSIFFVSILCHVIEHDKFYVLLSGHMMLLWTSIFAYLTLTEISFNIYLSRFGNVFIVGNVFYNFWFSIVEKLWANLI